MIDHIQKLINYIKSFFFVLQVLFAVILVWNISMISIILDTIGFSKLGRQLMRYAKKAWISAALVAIPSQKIVLTGDIEKFKSTLHNPAIVICNHQTYFDWWYIWLLAHYYGKGDCLNILLKSSLRNIPLLGRVMSEAGFLFLDRNWETDNKNINDYMSHFTQADRDDWLLIFPEGTIRHENTLQVSHAYAQKTHRPLLDYVLLPHSTGLTALLSPLYEHQKLNGHPAYLYNVTMQFRTFDGSYPTDSCFGGSFKGEGMPHVLTFTVNRHPVECHIHIETISIDEVLGENTTDLTAMKNHTEEWLDKKYLKKEEEIKYFVDNQHFELQNDESVMVMDYSYVRRFVGIILSVLNVGIVYLLGKGLVSFLLLPYRLFMYYNK